MLSRERGKRLARRCLPTRLSGAMKYRGQGTSMYAECNRAPDKRSLQARSINCGSRAITALADGCIFCRDAAYVQSLIAAAQDGVDVRLLVPGASDIPVLSGLSRVGYRPLLDGGVRVFEWNGAMMHAQDGGGRRYVGAVGSTALILRAG